MPLDSQVVAYLQAEQEAGSGGQEPLSLEEQRRQAVLNVLAEAGEPEPIAAVEDRLLAGPGGDLLLRIYTPAGSGSGPLPALVYFHSGGWVFGSVEGHDPICRALANHARCLVVSVDYRLAPEHPFPAAPEDCYAATLWVAEHAHEINVDPERMAVGGDSSGGNLAAAVALMARDRGGPRLRQQVLIYSETDYYEPGTASYRTYAEGYSFTSASLAWFWDQYLSKPEDRLHPYAAPLRAKNLSGLTPALIITAEYDPVRDEAEAYAQRLQQAGVPTRLSRYDGMIHGFFRQFAIFARSHDALAEIAATLQEAFTTGASSRHH